MCVNQFPVLTVGGPVLTGTMRCVVAVMQSDAPSGRQDLLKASSHGSESNYDL